MHLDAQGELIINTALLLCTYFSSLPRLATARGFRCMTSICPLHDNETSLTCQTRLTININGYPIGQDLERSSEKKRILERKRRRSSYEQLNGFL